MHVISQLGLMVAVGGIVLGILVFVHELGHFLVAKWFKFRVLAFSLGFGKVLWKKSVGETEYRLSLIPFGGYVQMAGDQPEEGHISAPDDFSAKPIYQRALVAVAGPVFNMIFAFLTLWVMFMLGAQQPVYLDHPVLGAVADSSEAAHAGLLPGDNILAINGRQVASWDDIQNNFLKTTGAVTVTIRRGAIDTTMSFWSIIEGRSIPKYSLGGMMPPYPAIIGAVRDGSPAAASGLLKGDSIVTINGAVVYSWLAVPELVNRYDSIAGPLAICAVRGDSTLNFAVRPVFSSEAGKLALGITVAQPTMRTVKYGPVKALEKGFQKSWQYTTMIFDVLSKLIHRQVSPQQLAGPVGIVQMSGMVAIGGIVAILDFMALIGINLAVLNLFPLIITDGGVLLFLLIEAIRRKPLPLNVQLMINRVAIALFITLFLYVTFNDIARVPVLLKMIGK